MIKEIKYNGYTATPSDYECPDGDLAVALNTVNENGALKPIPCPDIMFSLPDQYQVVSLHKTALFTHYIIRCGCDLFWSDSATPDVLNPLFTMPASDRLPQLTLNPIGNLIYLACIDTIDDTKSTTAFLVWDSSQYKTFTQPPFTTLEFKLTSQEATGDYTTTFLVSDDARSAAAEWAQNNGASASQRDISPFKNDISNAVWGAYLSHISDKVTSLNCFHQPFFIRYAFRFFDSTNAFHSAPVLIIPNSRPPLAKAEVSYSDGALTLNVSTIVPCGQLCYRALSPDIQKLTLWKDFITHIDIFCSVQVYTYDQDREITRTVPGYSNTLSTAMTQLDAKYAEITAESAADAYYWDIPAFDDKTIKEEICSCANFYRIASIPIDDIINPPADTSSAMRPGSNSSQDSTLDRFLFVPMDKNCLQSIVTRPALVDDYNSHCTLIARDALTYNNRLNLASTIRRLFNGYPIRSATPFLHISQNNDYDKAQLPYMTIHLRKNSIQYSVSHYPDRSHIDNPETSPFVIDDPNNPHHFPRFLFYPDPDAYRVDLIFIDRRSDTQKRCVYQVPLTKHDFLNGAYYFRGFGDDMPPCTDFGTEDTPVIPYAAGTDIINEPNKIYTSEVNNPFFFPLLGINTIGTGDILGICSAAKALSEGQFGQFPLYAFTTEGIWALEVSDTGTYSARQPISRDVCINPGSITPIDSAVLFASDRGIMIISGSAVKCLSSQLFPNSIEQVALNLPLADALISHFNSLSDDKIADPAIFNPAPFLQFIAECGIIYDYTNQRFIVFNPHYPYAYVYSFASLSWGMMLSSITSAINSYPQALAMAALENSATDGQGNTVVTTSSALVDLSSAPTAQKKVVAFILTRPLKMDYPDIFKTIDTVIQRGYFNYSECLQLIYASNDLFSWFPVYSAYDRRLRGCSGTPYKYFRIAFIARISAGHSIDGCSISFRNRLTNRLR